MPVTNLTRVEAGQRARMLSVESYDVGLDLTTGDKLFRSETTVRFAGHDPGASTFIDLIAHEVHEVVWNGRPLEPADVFDGARIRLDDVQAENRLTVVADCLYMNTGEGLHRFVDPVDDEVYVYSQFEVADARRVFTVFDQPDLKATFTFSVTAPAHWLVVSNSPAAAAGPTSVPTTDERVVWQFETTPLLASYVTAVIAGPYVGTRSELTSIDGRTIPLGVYCRASLAQFLDADNILDVTRTGFAFYEKAFGMPYPFAKYDQMFVPEFNAGAMENAGAVTFLEGYVFRSKVTDAMVERRALTVLHELAHMWFGDLVTMRWWDDLWLNESFAEYASTVCMAEATAWRGAWTTFASMEKAWAYRQDQLPSTHPVAADIRDLEDVEVNFDGITYAKGASVLKQLVAWVGREQFDEGVRAYFRTHAWGNTELSDLLTELETTSGRDLGAWSQEWLQRAGVTTLSPRLTCAGGVISELHVEQQAPQDHPHLRAHRLAIGGYHLVEGVLKRVWRVELDIDGASTLVGEAAGLVAPDLLLLNDDDLAYAKIRLDPASLSTAVEHLGAFEDSLPRTLVWGAAWDMTRDAETTPTAFVDLVCANITAETDSSVVLTVLRQLAATVQLYISRRTRPDVQARVGTRLLHLARAAAPGSDIQLQLIKAVAAHAVTPELLAAVHDLLDGGERLAGLEIDTDLRWELVTSLAAGGALTRADIDSEVTRDDTASGRRAAAAARAALPSPDGKEELWSQVVEAQELPNAVQASIISGFMRVNDPALLEPFVDRYFAALEPVWSTRTNEIAQQIVVGLYPSALAGPDLLARTDAWLDTHGQDQPALRRLVGENRDGVQRAMRAQELDRRS